MFEPSELAALIISGAVCIVGLAGFVFGRRDVAENKNKEENKDSKEAGRQESLIMNKLGVVEKGIDGIERRLDRQDERYIDLAQRVTATEASTKQAHHRIDALETKRKENDK